jgi:hypothetical protein
VNRARLARRDSQALALPTFKTRTAARACPGTHTQHSLDVLNIVPLPLSRDVSPVSLPAMGPNRRAQERQRAAAQKNCGDLECPLGRWVTEGIRLRKQQFSREVSQCELYMSRV